MSARLDKYQLHEAWTNREKSDDINCEKKKNVKTKNKRISQKTKKKNNKKTEEDEDEGEEEEIASLLAIRIQKL